MQNKAIAEIARSQHGLFTRSQARAAGLKDRTLDGRVANSLYERILPEVFGLPGVDTWQRRVTAAVLSASEPAAASHQTAAHLWGLMDHRPTTIEVVCRRHHRVRRAGMVIHESKDLLETDIAVIDGIAVTNAVRTIVDLGASAPLGVVARSLDTGLRNANFTIGDIQEFIRRVSRPGRAGIGAMRILIEERLTWTGLTESALEDAFRSLVERAGLPMPLPQYELCDQNGTFVGRFDFAYQPNRVLIELDSERWHMDPETFQRDRSKQNRAHTLGWTVYRFTWQQIRHEPHNVVAALASVSAK